MTAMMNINDRTIRSNWKAFGNSGDKTGSSSLGVEAVGMSHSRTLGLFASGKMSVAKSHSHCMNTLV